MGLTPRQRIIVVVLISVAGLAACAGPAMMSRGISYLNAGQFDKAISDFTIAIRHEPNDAALWNLRGVAHYRSAQFDHAVSDFSRAIKLDPNNVLFLTNRADAYRKTDRPELALKDLERALKLDAHNKTAHDLLSSIKAGSPESGTQTPDSSSEKEGWLGVSIQSITPEVIKSFHLAEAKGAFVAQVFEGSPASKAGLLADDVILEFNRIPVSGSKELVALIRENAPGSNALLKVWRNGAPIYLVAILGARPPDAGGTPAPVSSPPATEEKAKETSERLKSEKAFEGDQTATSAPSLEIHGIAVRPSTVRMGSDFDVEIVYTASDATRLEHDIKVAFSFSISKAGKVLLEGKQEEILAGNGMRGKITKHLTAARKEGEYVFEVTMHYRQQIARMSQVLRVE